MDNFQQLLPNPYTTSPMTAITGTPLLSVMVRVNKNGSEQLKHSSATGSEGGRDQHDRTAALGRTTPL